MGARHDGPRVTVAVLRALSRGLGSGLRVKG